MARDFYEVLGVVARRRRRRASSAPTASWPARYHPDVNKDPAAEERFKEITEAYDVLSDPETRRRYDRFGHDFRQVPEDVDPQTWAARRRRRRPGGRPPGGGRTGATATRRLRRRRASSGIDLEDLFGEHVRRPAARRAGRSPGADQEAELDADRRGGLPRRAAGRSR